MIQKLRSSLLKGAASAMLIAGAAASPALAQNPGPDVIVGDLIDTFGYGSQGTPAYFAYDIGTVSCNVGNVNLLWISTTNQHPVIAQNIYRLKNGRLEQLGGSWVKHGFYALTLNLCSTCNGQGESVLGVGCSDPYDFGLNGQQSGLGPRSEINAATGAFAFNPGGWPGYSPTDNLARRIRVLGSEVDPSLNAGALYFGEAMYIAADDAGAGNSHNNASYRRMRFNQNANLTPTFLFTGVTPAPTTQRTKPAIHAWSDYGGGTDANGQPVADANVRVRPIDVPGDGRLWIAHKVVDNGDGTWRYEYAVMNMTSDRSGASFSVPLAPGTVVTGAGFRGLAAHSGEPYNSADWVFNAGAASASWTCAETFAQNPDANALRWGTMYNFWFDASVAPVESAATVGLFKPGQGAFAAMNSVSVALRAPGVAAAPAAPVNNACANATAAHSGQNAFSSLGATGAGPDACDSGGPGTGAIQADVWFRYTYQPYADACPGSITIDTCGSDFDAKIAVYAGASCPAGAPIACSDGGGPCGGTSAGVTFPATIGATYLIRVGSLAGASGNGILNIVPPFCIGQSGACCFSNGTCIDMQGSFNCMGGTFMGPGVTCLPANPCPEPQPPANDLCANAQTIGDSALGWPAVAGTNLLANTDLAPMCDFGVQGQHNVWFAYTPVRTESVRIDTCQFPASGLAFDTVLFLYSSCSGGAAQIGCNDDVIDCPNRSAITATLTAGQRYLISVAGFFDSTGDFVVRVTGGGGGVSPPGGACCRGTTCVVLVAAQCAGSGESFGGAGSVCNAPGSATTPCCKADFDHNGAVTIDDIFNYLNAWFSGSPRAAIITNGVGMPAITDIFAFLNAWFAQC